MTLFEKAQKIRLLICDVDGVLTDGKIYIGNEGELFKAFDVKDGLGIKMLLANGIDVAILTARSSEILKKRTQELGITNVLQGQRDKVKGLQELLSVTGFKPENIAYIGDDLFDLAVMNDVGFPATVADATDEAKSVAILESDFAGGHGAVRQIIEFILKAQGKWQSIVDGYMHINHENKTSEGISQ